MSLSVTRRMCASATLRAEKVRYEELVVVVVAGSVAGGVAECVGRRMDDSSSIRRWEGCGNAREISSAADCSTWYRIDSCQAAIALSRLFETLAPAQG